MWLHNNLLMLSCYLGVIFSFVPPVGAQDLQVASEGGTDLNSICGQNFAFNSCSLNYRINSIV
jgi:hypothetical protein